MAYCGKWTAHFERKFNDFSGTVRDIESATKLVQIYETENKLSCGFSTSVATVQDTAVDLKDASLAIEWNAYLPSSSVTIPFLGFPFSVGKNVIIQWPSEISSKEATDCPEAESLVLVELITFPGIQISSNTAEERSEGVEALQKSLDNGSCSMDRTWVLRLPEVTLPTVRETAVSVEPTDIKPSALHCSEWADSMLRGLQALRANRSQCDVTLVGEDGSIDAHSTVLCAASPKFKALLERSQIQMVVKLESFSTETLRSVVDFIYGGKAAIGPGSVGSVQQMAEGFEINGLVQACQTQRTKTGVENEKADKTTGENLVQAVKCRVLDKTSESPTRVKFHNLSHLQGKQHWCQKCGINLEPCNNSTCNPGLTRAKTAKVPRAPQKLYSCSTCELTFKKKEALVKHQHRHNGTSLYTCQYCSKGFMDRDCFQSHVKQHQGIKTAVCDLCGIEVTTLKGLKKHKDTMHERKEKYRCGTCGATYRHRSSFAAHCLIHQGKKPHVCQYCNKGFRVGSHLRSHLRTHTGEKPYECDLCGKKFAHSNSCKGHRNICQGPIQRPLFGRDGQKTAPSAAGQKSPVQVEKSLVVNLPRGTQAAPKVENMECQPLNLIYIVNDNGSDPEGSAENSGVENVPQGGSTAEMVQTEVVDSRQDVASIETVEHCVDGRGCPYITLSDGNKLYISLSQDSDLQKHKQKANS